MFFYYDHFADKQTAYSTENETESRISRNLCVEIGYCPWSVINVSVLLKGVTRVIFPKILFFVIISTSHFFPEIPLFNAYYIPTFLPPYITHQKNVSPS